MMQLPHRLIWGQLSRHKSKFGAQRCLHETTVTQPPTVASPPPVPPSQGKEVKEIQIPVPWGHISGKWWGRTDIQPVLMLHGWQDNAGTFDALAPLLDNEALLALDLVGHGQSSHYPLGQCYSYPDGINVLRRVVRHFGWEKKVSLIGHSLGSVLAFTYAGVFPDGVDTFVSIDCVRGALWTLASAFEPAGANLRRAIEASLSHEWKVGDATSRPWQTFEEILNVYLKGSKGSVTRGRSRAIVERGVVASTHDPERFAFTRDRRLKTFAWSSGMFAEGMCALSAQIACRVLDIRAAESFTKVPDTLRLYEKSLGIVALHARRHECHVVEGTHHVHLNAPELVAPLVNDFFRMKEEEVIY